jgi:hypothetical protein
MVTEDRRADLDNRAHRVRGMPTDLVSSLHPETEMVADLDLVAMDHQEALVDFAAVDLDLLQNL